MALGITALVFFNGNVLGVEEEFITQFPEVFNVLAVIGLFGCFFMPALVVLFSLLPRIGATMVKWFISIGGKLKIIKDPKKTEYKTLKTVVHNSVCIKRFAKDPVALFTTVLLGFAENLAQCSIAFFTLKLFGYNNPDAGVFLEWLQIMQLSFILYAGISFIPTPGNSGAADLSFYLLFSVGVPFMGLAFSAMVLWRILSFYSYIIIGFVYALNTKRLGKTNDSKLFDIAGFIMFGISLLALMICSYFYYGSYIVLFNMKVCAFALGIAACFIFSKLDNTDIYKYLAIILGFLICHSESNQIYAQNKGMEYVISLSWVLYSGITTIAGILRNKKYLINTGIALIILSILRIFIYDLAHVEAIFKLIAFLALGIILMLVSYIYTTHKNKQ